MQDKLGYVALDNGQDIQWPGSSLSIMDALFPADTPFIVPVSMSQPTIRLGATRCTSWCRSQNELVQYNEYGKQQRCSLLLF